jgi:hypothetical protein
MVAIKEKSMNYLKVYMTIISHAKNENRKKSIEYLFDENGKKHQRSIAPFYEGHHILPKSLGGEGSSANWKHTNIVPLTSREHFFCHQLLTKIYPGKKTAYALWSMITFRSKKLTSREYERIKEMLYSYRKNDIELNKKIGELKKKKIICIETNEIFDSINDASEKYKIQHSAISNAAIGIYFTAGGLTWRFLDKELNIINPKLNKVHTTRCKKIRCITTNEIFDSLKDAENKYKITHCSISKAAKGVQFSSGKLDGIPLLWEFLDKKEKSIVPASRKKQQIKKKKVICITTGEIFDSFLEAGKKYNRASINIINAAKGNVRSSGYLDDGTPLLWRYLDFNNNIIEIDCKATGFAKRRVKCLTTGLVFATITEASKFYNINRVSISMNASGKLGRAGMLNGEPLHWEYC